MVSLIWPMVLLRAMDLESLFVAMRLGLLAMQALSEKELLADLFRSELTLSLREWKEESKFFLLRGLE